MSDPFAGLSAQATERLEERSHPGWLEPMLATPTDGHFSDPGWILECELDAERCLGLRRDEEAGQVQREEPGGRS